VSSADLHVVESTFLRGFESYLRSQSDQKLTESCPALMLAVPGTLPQFSSASTELMDSIALRRSSVVKCPYRAAVLTMVLGDQPTILATFAIGTPALNMRESRSH
jgi:hypothetical protein